MSQRKRTGTFYRLFVVIAAGLLISAVTWTFLPYSDAEAERIAIRVRQHHFAGGQKPPEEVFRELQISRLRLSFHRSSGMMNGTWDTWRLSQCYELVLYGDAHSPGKFFRAEVDYQPDRMFFVKLLIPALAMTIGAGVILSVIRWANCRVERRLVNVCDPNSDSTSKAG